MNKKPAKSNLFFLIIFVSFKTKAAIMNPKIQIGRFIK